MKSDKSNHKSVFLAAITASLIVMAFGLTYHTLAAKLAAPVTNIHIVPEALDQLPMEIAGWIGEDLPMDKEIVRATGTDTYINRYYSRKNGLESVSLFIGCSVSIFEQAIHRPEICYTRNGWELINRRSAELSLNNGVKIPNSIFRFSHGVLKRKEAVVLHYYVVDGQYYEEIFPWQVKLWRLNGTADYIARVMIVAYVKTSTVKAAEKLVSSFAVDSANSIAELFESVHNNQVAQIQSLR